MATHTPDQLTNIAAVKLIEDTGISILEAALLVRELYQGLGGRGKGIMRARLCIQLGKKELHQREKTVSFHQGVEETLKAKQHRRPRTLAEINYICTRLMKSCPELKTRPLRAMYMQEWRRLHTAHFFHAPPAAQGKGGFKRHFLHGTQTRLVCGKSGVTNRIASPA